MLFFIIGVGNDFIVIEERGYGHLFNARVCRQLCQRGLSVGADGMLQVGPPLDSNNHARFAHINSDGSVSQMCGNGIRVFAKYLYDRKIAAERVLRIETPSGVRTVEVEVDPCSDTVTAVRVDMGSCLYERHLIPMAGAPDSTALNVTYTVPVTGTVYNTVCCANTGGENVSLPLLRHLHSPTAPQVPHAIFFVPSVDEARVVEDGPHIMEDKQMWPARVNAGFVQVVDRQHIRLRFWERGAGVTLGCGTGACAAVALGIKTDRLDGGERPIRCDLPGGTIHVQLRQSDGHLFMTGPAVLVYNAQMRVAL